MVIEIAPVLMIWLPMFFLLASFFVNFFIKTWLVCFVNVFVCIYIITIQEQNEWLMWGVALILAYSVVDGIMKLFSEAFR